MQHKDRILNVYNLINKNFLMPFYFTTFFVCLLFDIVNIKFPQINNHLILYLELIFGFLTFFLWFKKLHDTTKLKKVIIEFLKVTFLSSLILITTFNTNFLTDFSFSKNINLTLTLIIIYSGIVTFYSNKDTNRKEVEKEQTAELETENNLYNTFPNKFVKIQKIPILKNTFRRMYKEGWIYVTGLTLILIFSALLIYPNLGGFDIYHDEGWSMQVLDSLKAGDGFHLRNYVTKQPELSYTQGQITIIGSSIFYYIFPSSLFWIRFFVATMGFLCTPVIYLVFKKFTSKSIALIITLFVSYNIIFLYLARFLRAYSLFLLSYLIVFLFINKIHKKLIENKYDKLIQYSCILLVFTIVALTEREIAKILLVNIPICLGIFLIRNKNILANFFKHKKIIIISSIVLLSLIIFLEYINILRLSSIVYQIPQQLSFDTILEPTTKYYQYLFENQIKNTYLAYIFFLFGVFYLLLNLKGYLNKTYLVIFTIIPLVFNVYLLNRSEDFRYIYHLIPFVLGIIVIGLHSIISIYIKNSVIRVTLCLGILLTILSYPMIPFLKTSNKFAVKSVTEWSGSDGDIYLHRRAVPPEYTKVYTYLNDNQTLDDNVLVIEDRTWNLKVIDGVNYYLIDDVWSSSSNFINQKTKSNTNFFDLVNTHQRIWVVGAYMHSIDHSINDYLLKNCRNISADLGIKKFNYNSYYKNKFYWPNLFLCD